MPAFFVLYVAAGKLGLLLAMENPSASPVWAPTGIALGGLLLFGPWVAAAVFIGAFVVNVTTAGNVTTSLFIAAGNTLEALIGAWLTQKYAGGRAVFTEPRHIFRFALVAGLLATAVSASIGVVTLLVNHMTTPENAWAAWITWWLGDGSGALLVTPLFLLWTQEHLPTQWRKRLWAEILALVTLLAVPILVFTGVLPAGLGFIGISLLVWASFRFGRRISATAVAFLAAFAVYGTLRGFGPFVRDSMNESLLLLQTFMAIMAITTLVMSAALAQRRKAADEVAAFANSLEDQVSERTHELALAIDQLRGEMAERQRVEAERERLLIEQTRGQEAERANQQKDEFLAVLSHELRTPLSAVLGWTELLRRANLDEDTRRRAVEAIDRNARIQNRLISDILEVSRITAGKLELKTERVDLGAILDAAVDLVRPQAASKRQLVSVQKVGRRLTVVGDLERLEQAISNILANAVKFTPEGGSVRTELHELTGSAEIVVADDGPGIDPEFLPYIFDRFRQSDATITRRYGGLGLGLSIARYIIERHGGSVSAANGQGPGAIFTVRLPVVATGPGPDDGAPSRDGAQADMFRTQPLRSLRVLVLDDQESAREIASESLRRCGAEVEVADSSSQALALVSTRSFDVLIVDLSMPGENGYEFLAKARQLPAVRETPALALTANAGAAEESRARHAGFQAFLTKPVRMATFAGVTARIARARPSMAWIAADSVTDDRSS